MWSEAALDEQLQLAPGRLAATREWHAGMPSDDDAGSFLCDASGQLLHFQKAGDHHRKDIRVDACGTAIGSTLEHRERGIYPRFPLAQNGVERACLRAIEIRRGKDPVASFAPRVVVAQDGLAIGFAVAPGQHADTERRDVLDAVQPGRYQLASIQKLEMRRAGDLP